MFTLRKFVFLFLASLIGFTLAFRLSQTVLAAKPQVVIEQQHLAQAQHKAAPISRRAEGNTS